MATTAAKHIAHEPADLLFHGLRIHTFAAVLASLLVLFCDLLTPFAHRLAPVFHLLSEFIRIVISFMSLSLMMATPSSMASSSASAVAATSPRTTSSEWETTRRVITFSSLWLIFVHDGEHSTRSLSRIIYLQEGMWVIFGCLAGSAVVKVLADCAFVSCTEDRSNAAAPGLQRMR